MGQKKREKDYSETTSSDMTSQARIPYQMSIKCVISDVCVKHVAMETEASCFIKFLSVNLATPPKSER